MSIPILIRSIPFSSVYIKWFCLFVLRFYGPVNPMGSCRARSVYLTRRLLGRQSSMRLASIVHILSPETDNCPSWISRRERMIVENISWSISTKECCRPRLGLNPWPSGLQLDGTSNSATEASKWFCTKLVIECSDQTEFWTHIDTGFTLFATHLDTSTGSKQTCSNLVQVW